MTLVPDVTLSGTRDVGGLAGPGTVTFTMRRGPGTESRLTADGLSPGASSAIQTYNQTFIQNGAWLTPTLILPASSPSSRRNSIFEFDGSICTLQIHKRTPTFSATTPRGEAA